MDLKNWLILGVAFITWGGVFVYLLRLSAMAKRLEEQMRDAEIEKEKV